MFYKAKAFDQSLNSWDTELVTKMASMFAEAETFNGDISAWETDNVETMEGKRIMFEW